MRVHSDSHHNSPFYIRKYNIFMLAREVWQFYSVAENISK